MANTTLLLDGVTFITTGLTGSYTDVDDDPASPDANWLTTSGSNTTFEGSFDTPPANLTTGAGLQTFRIWVRKDAAGGGDPTVDIHLYENGVDLGALISNTTVTSTTGELVSATWDASLLSNIDGSQVEIYCDGTKGGGGPNERNVEYGAFAWDAEHAVPSTIASFETVTRTNITSINGIALASVKSVNTVAN